MNFFTPNPSGTFKIFSIYHIIFMIASLLLIYIIGNKYKNCKKEKIEKFIKIMAIIILTFDPMYWFWEFAHFGQMRLGTSLPLYLCSLFWILLPFVAFAKKESKIYKIAISWICTVSFVGGFMGMFFCVYLNKYPFFHFVPIRSLTYHFFMLLVPYVLRISGYYKSEIKDAMYFYIPNLILLLPSFILDKIFGWDYGYLNGGAGTPFAFFSSIMPLPVFIIVLYSLLYFAMCFGFYHKHINLHLKNKMQLKQSRN